jgi:hypothetical protein
MVVLPMGGPCLGPCGIGFIFLPSRSLFVTNNVHVDPAAKDRAKAIPLTDEPNITFRGVTHDEALHVSSVPMFSVCWRPLWWVLTRVAYPHRQSVGERPWVYRCHCAKYALSRSLCGISYVFRGSRKIAVKDEYLTGLPVTQLP